MSETTDPTVDFPQAERTEERVMELEAELRQVRSVIAVHQQNGCGVQLLSDERAEKAEADLDRLRMAATLYCCHVTGVHDPRHFVERRFVCAFQKSAAYENVRKALGWPPSTPDEVQPSVDCYWCESAGLLETEKDDGPLLSGGAQ